MATKTRTKEPKRRRMIDSLPIRLPLGEFKAAFQAVSRAVPGRTPMPVLHNVKLEIAGGKATFQATNLELWIRREIPCGHDGDPVSALLPHKTWADILRTADGDEIGLDVEDRQVVVACRSADWTVRTDDPALFPAMPAFDLASHVEVQGDRLALLINRTIGEARDKGGDTPIFTGLCMEPLLLALELTGTNGASLAHQRVEAMAVGQLPSLPQPPIVPATAMKALAQLIGDDDSPVHVGFPNDRQVVFRTASTTLLCRLLEGRFPRWRDAMPADPIGTVTFRCGELREAIGQASVHLSETTHGVDFIFVDDVLTLDSTGSQEGDAHVEIATEWPHDRTEFTLDPQYLVGMLRALGDEATVLLDVHPGNAPLGVRTEDGFLGFAMPLTRDR